MNCVIERKDTQIEIAFHGISLYEIEPTVLVIDGRPRKIGNDSDVWHVLITYRYKQYACGVVAKKMANWSMSAEDTLIHVFGCMFQAFLMSMRVFRGRCKKSFSGSRLWKGKELLLSRVK